MKRLGRYSGINSEEIKGNVKERRRELQEKVAVHAKEEKVNASSWTQLLSLAKEFLISRDILDEGFEEALCVMNRLLKTLMSQIPHGNFPLVAETMLCDLVESVYSDSPNSRSYRLCHCCKHPGYANYLLDPQYRHMFQPQQYWIYLYH
jgi:hypothetical protein